MEGVLIKICHLKPVNSKVLLGCICRVRREIAAAAHFYDNFVIQNTYLCHRLELSMHDVIGSLAHLVSSTQFHLMKNLNGRILATAAFT